MHFKALSEIYRMVPSDFYEVIQEKIDIFAAWIKQNSKFWRRELSKNPDFGGANQAKVDILAAWTKQKSRFVRRELSKSPANKHCEFISCSWTLVAAVFFCKKDLCKYRRSWRIDLRFNCGLLWPSRVCSGSSFFFVELEVQCSCETCWSLVWKVWTF